MATSLRAPVSWVVYDLANTLYSAIVVTFLINPYVESILHAATYAATANFCSMIAAGLVAPAFGEATDHAGTSKRWLIVTTLITCVACGGMAAAHALAAPGTAVVLVLLCFGAGNFCYQLSLVFYNSLLPGLVPENRIGLWSGLGVGVGYFGMTLGMLALGVLFDAFPAGAPVTDKMASGFLAAGVFFALFSLPLFLWVPSRPARAGAQALRLVDALRQSFVIWRRNLGEPRARRFLLGNFFLTDVLNTTIFVFSLYCVRVFDAVHEVTDPPVRTALIVLSLSALVLGTVGGKLSDRLGPRRALLAAGGSLGVALLAGTLLPASRFYVFLGFVATFGAFGLAGIWAAGRALLLKIAPPDRVGEYFGMYGLSLKVSVAGAILFGLLADYLPFDDVGLRYRCAMASGFLPLALGLWFIGRLQVDPAPPT